MIQRIKYFMMINNLTAAQLASKVKISKYTLDKYLQGVNPISSRFIAAFLATFPNISRDWFIDGTGEMEIDKSNLVPADFIPTVNIQECTNNGIDKSELSGLYVKLFNYHIDEMQKLHIELDKAHEVIDRLTDILARKSGL